MSKPVFVCVPEASHSQLIYEPLRSILSFHGYTTVPLALPSVGGNPPTYDFREDVQAIRNLVTQIVDSGADVILVLHGYGGLPGAEALQGLGRDERSQRGLRGGVVRLVFIMSYMAVEGFQGSPRGDVSSMFPYMRCNVQAGISTIKPADALSVFYNDMSIPQAEYWSSQLLPQSLGVFWSRTSYAAWRYIPSTYVLCARDQSMSLSYGEMILKAAQDSKPNMVDSVERCDAGHCVMLSQPDWTANMLRRAAGERV
ncbi:Alpha/beta hydrolase fold-1 [Rhexocercosporidium sp. MPI-PUGE-AT-0058]|nr:Alpha/beta hydrolase fold-1 [Rhexocercosporidium sp. MPI-PUGE-AT-0058]